MKSFAKITQEIKDGHFAPVYLLDGEEPFYIDRLLENFEASIPEEEKDFNLVNFYGKDTEWQEILTAARQFPMFGERLLIILREAGQMNQINQLCDYIQASQPSTVLVIEHRFKKMDSRSKLAKLINQKGVHFTSNPLRENQIPAWIIQYCQSQGSQISQANATILATYLGSDLQKIANELHKIWLNSPVSEEVTAEKIEKYIGINRDYNVLQLPPVLFEQQSERLSRMLNYFQGNPAAGSINAVVAIFCGYLQKIYLAQLLSSDFNRDKQLGIWKAHRQVAMRYSPLQIHKSILLLGEFARKAVGIDTTSREGLLTEFIGKMLAILRN